MENTKSKDLFISILSTIIVLLFVSNVYFYVEFKDLEYKSTYDRRFSSAISLAANSNEMSFILSELAPYESNELVKKFEEIKADTDNTYSIKNYIAIKYKNGNTLMLETNENRDGKHLITDMFLLDESTYKNINADRMSEN